MEHAGRDSFVRADDELESFVLGQIATAGVHFAITQAVQVAQLVGDLWRRGVESVGVRQRVDLAGVPRFLGIVAQTLPQLVSAALEPFVGVGCRRVAGQVPHGALVERGQHVGLPAIPDARSDGREIGSREHEQHIEHLGRAHVDGEPQHELRIGNVAPHCQMRHDEVLVHEKLERFGFAQRQAQVLGRFFGDPQAQFAVVFDKSLAQIVDEQSQMQGALLFDAPVDATQDSLVVDEIGGPLDGQNAVFVHGKAVILVELEQAASVCEGGHDDFQQAGFVQAAQQLAQPSGLRQQRQELAADVGVHLVGKVRPGGADGFPGGRVDAFVLQIGQHAQLEHFAQAGLQLLLSAVSGHDLAIGDAVIPLDLMAEDRAGELGPELTRPPFGGRVARDAAHGAGVAKIFAHELFDTQDGFVAFVLIKLGQTHLFGAVEHVVKPTGVKMEFVAHAQQELAGFAEPALVFLRKRPQKLQPGRIGGAVADKAEPPHELQIAQAAARILDVGFQQVDRFAVLRALGAASAFDRLEQVLRAGLRLARKAIDKRLEQLRVAGQKPRLRQRRAELRIFLGQSAGLAERAQAVPPFQAHVGEILQQLPGHRKNGLVGARRVKDHQVDVGVGRHFAAAVTAVGHERQLGAKLLGVLRPQVSKRAGEQVQHDPIQQVGQPRTHLDSRRAGPVLPVNLLAAVEQVLARRENRGTKGGYGGHGGIGRRRR